MAKSKGWPWWLMLGLIFLSGKVAALCVVVSGIDYDHNDALVWSQQYLGEKHNVAWRRQHWTELPHGTMIMSPHKAVATVAGKTCTIFASWRDLVAFLNDPPDEFRAELAHAALLIYQGTHGVPGGEAHCNDGEYILGRQIIAALRQIHNLEYLQHHHIAVLVDSCFSGDLLRKLLLVHARETEDLKRVCMVTSSSFGQESYQGAKFYELLARVRPGEDISLLQHFKAWFPQEDSRQHRNALISAGYFDYLGLTEEVLYDFALPPTQDFLRKMAVILEQDARETGEVKYLKAFYHLTAAQDKSDIYVLNDGQAFSWEDQNTFYFQQFQTRFYIEDLIKRLQEGQRAWRQWKKQLHDVAQEWVMSAAQEFLAVVVSGLRNDQQMRGELINYYRLQELVYEAWSNTLPANALPPVNFAHPDDAARVLAHLTQDLPLAPPSAALPAALRMQARLARWNQIAPFAERRVWEKNATDASLTQMAQIILQGRLQSVPLAAAAANTLAQVSWYLLNHSPEFIGEGDYNRLQACAAFNFKDI